MYILIVRFKCFMCLLRLQSPKFSRDPYSPIEMSKKKVGVMVLKSLREIKNRCCHSPKIKILAEFWTILAASLHPAGRTIRPAAFSLRRVPLSPCSLLSLLRRAGGNSSCGLLSPRRAATSTGRSRPVVFFLSLIGCADKSLGCLFLASSNGRRDVVIINFQCFVCFFVSHDFFFGIFKPIFI